MSDPRDEVFIVGMARTPIGAFQGGLSEIPAPKLGAVAIQAALGRASVPADKVDELYMGCVLPAGQGQAPARQAGHHAGLPRSVPAVTVNKVCGSGLQAVVFGASSIRLGEAQVVVAGGMESMSRAPYLLPKARGGPAAGARPDDRLDDPGRAVGRLRRRAHGRLRRAVRAREGHLPGGSGRPRGRVVPAGAGGAGRGQVRRGDRRRRGARSARVRPGSWPQTSRRPGAIPRSCRRCERRSRRTGP